MAKTILAVTGSPILHSKSPNIFNTVLSAKGIDACYFRLAADSAREAVAIFKDLGLKGMNVTAPFKADVMAQIDHVDEHARTIGAVNTVVNNRGVLTGYNTDFIGVVKSFEDNRISVKGRKCTVIGAGGAGRAVIYALVTEGADVVIIDKYQQAADEAASHFGARSLPYEQIEDQVRNAEVIVYAIDSSIRAIEPEWINGSQVMFDVNYKQSFVTETALEKGCKLITGGDMLVNQAIPGFNYYLGAEVSALDVWAGFHNAMPEYKKTRIALIGFMAAGKTTIGKPLAKKLGYSYVDTDDIIISKAGESIPEIFKNRGESVFRRIEKEVLDEVLQMDEVVISCGGGVIVNDENRQAVRERCLGVWVYARPETCVGRIHDQSRPLLNTPDPVAEAKKIFQGRIGLYAEAADLLINTEHGIFEESMEKLYGEICKAFGY